MPLQPRDPPGPSAFPFQPTSPGGLLSLCLAPLSARGLDATGSSPLSLRSGARTTRKPRLLFSFSGLFLLRFADRQFLAELFQLPPRFTRLSPDEGPEAAPVQTEHDGGSACKQHVP